VDGGANCARIQSEWEHSTHWKTPKARAKGIPVVAIIAKGILSCDQGVAFESRKNAKDIPVDYNV
jgi:hypothetical protein